MLDVLTDPDLFLALHPLVQIVVLLLAAGGTALAVRLALAFIEFCHSLAR